MYKAKTQTINNTTFFHRLFLISTNVSGVLLYLEDFVVEVILKCFAVLWVLFLFLELFVSFGAGTASSPLALLLRLVPLFLLITVHLSGHPRRQLHPWGNGVWHHFNIQSERQFLLTVARNTDTHHGLMHKLQTPSHANTPEGHVWHFCPQVLTLSSEDILPLTQPPLRLPLLFSNMGVMGVQKRKVWAWLCLCMETHRWEGINVGQAVTGIIQPK